MNKVKFTYFNIIYINMKIECVIIGQMRINACSLQDCLKFAK